MSELLEQLRGAGTLEARGRFTLDSEQAREKLRQFQLADPHRYVLLLVEAMTLAGAGKLGFAIDADDVRLRCICRPFAYEQLVDLYGSLFVTVDASLDARARSHLRGLQQLAFALNSAMALHPRFVRVESVDAEGRGVLLELRPEQPDRIERIAGGEPGTRVHVRDRFRPGLVVEFFRSVGGKVAEQQLLRRHCRWSPIPIELDGETISHAYALDGEAWHSEPIHDEGRLLGLAALQLVPPGASEPGPAFVELLCHGVWIERMPLEQRLPGFAAIVDDARLGRDVSQASITRDDALDHVTLLLREAEAKLVARLATRMREAHARAGIPAWASALLRAWLVGAATPGKAASKGKRLVKLLERPHFAAVAELPLWPRLGTASTSISTRALIEGERVLYSEELFVFVPAEVVIVDLSEPELRAGFMRVFGERAVDHAPFLRAEQERERQRLAFAARAHAPQLPSGHYLRREPLQGFVGELALRSLGPRDSWLRLIVKGCLLQELVLERPIPGLCGVVEAELQANDDWTHARPDAALAKVGVELMRGLERLLRGLAAETSDITYELRELLRAYVRAVSDRGYALDVLGQLGFAEAEARALLRKLPSEGLVPDWQLDGASAHPLAHVPLYEQASGAPLSLHELAAWRRGGERIAWLDHDVGPLPTFDRGVLLLDAADRVALRTIFGEGAFERYHDRLARLRRREAFLANPPQRLELAHASIAGAPLHDARVRGELALREFSARSDTILATQRLTLRVFHDARFLQDVELDAPLPGLTAWLDSTQLDVADDYRSLARTSEVRPILLDALPKLIARVVEQIGRARGGPRRCELWFVLRVAVELFGDVTLVRALAELRAAGRPREIASLLGLLDRWSSRELTSVLGRLRGRGELPSAALVERELASTTSARRPSEQELESGRLRIALAELCEVLLALPLLRVLEPGGRASTHARASLDELLVHVRAGSTIAWVPESMRFDALPAMTGHVLALDGVELRVIQQLFGADACEDVSAWLSGRARFEARRRVDEVRLPRGQALVQLEVREAEVRGELGLVHEVPRAAGRSRIRVFHEGRHVTDLDLALEPLALIGALEFATLELAVSHDALEPAGFTRVRMFVERYVKPLVDGLIERYADLHGNDRIVAAEQLRHVLVAWPPGSGGYASRAKREARRFERLAELAIFPGARRPWTGSELAEAAGLAKTSQGRPLATIEARVDRPLPEGPVLVLERPDVLDVLVALYGKPRDLTAEWARDDEIARIMAAAPRLPQRPEQPLAAIALGREGVEGELWWAPGSEPRVGLGVGDRRFGWRDAPPDYPCTGWLRGAEVAVAGDYSRASLGRGGERLLEQAAIALWTTMVDEFERLDAEPNPAHASRHAGLREALCRQVLQLHARRGAPKTKAGKSGKSGKSGKAGGRAEQLLARLWSLRLLRLASGHHISAEVAQRERPIELASLSLWQGPSAEEQAARAAERKDAAARRAAELEQERERERERRRAEEREAQRRAAEGRRARAEAARAEQLREQAERARAQERRSAAQAEAAATPRRADPVALLLDAVRDELRLVRAKREGLLDNRHLEMLVIDEHLDRPGPRGPLFRVARIGAEIAINVEHPLVQAALEHRLDDPFTVTLLASLVYGQLNRVLSDIAGEDEAEFLILHAAHAASLF